ncbi:MAG: YpdA family putative bacillithiol disulfide reductase [Candidatus Hydrogenedentes bacterium]|nr:YpdA family putative bacillithiol disulfide reductase [Candidatus Hydrogenedentota bacterium]
MKTYGLDATQDIIVVGAGPAGLGVLLAAKQAGLSAVAIDKGPVASALCSHPTYMRWFSTTDKLELGDFPLVSTEKNPTRQEYLAYLRAFVRFFDLKVTTYREVKSILAENDLFRVAAMDMYEREFVWSARHVVVATGFYDSPRRMNIVGENLPKVSHRYSEAHWYAGHDVLVIGAGSSAAEVALELYRSGAHVTVAMRGTSFETKYWIEPDIENRIKEGSIECYRNVEVEEIRPDEVVLCPERGPLITIPNDFVLAMTGYEPDTSLISSLGAVIDGKCRKPLLNHYFETTVPGLYVAGTLCAGTESNTVFVENSRDHGPRIVEHILKKR